MTAVVSRQSAATLLQPFINGFHAVFLHPGDDLLDGVLRGIDQPEDV